MLVAGLGAYVGSEPPLEQLRLSQEHRQRGSQLVGDDRDHAIARLALQFCALARGPFDFQLMLALYRHDDANPASQCARRVVPGHAVRPKPTVHAISTVQAVLYLPGRAARRGGTPAVEAEGLVVGVKRRGPAQPAECLCRMAGIGAERWADVVPGAVWASGEEQGGDEPKQRVVVGKLHRLRAPVGAVPLATL